ncbi:hypothetical protein PQR62_12865 [Herbaspirillum lusitanum]|uniref:DUF4198 domain-containing protein n=1 Tax=Herbaspirillum lusitanum TaxID=213312 RepID=A0ABW9A8G8_9BURK
MKFPKLKYSADKPAPAAQASTGEDQAQPRKHLFSAVAVAATLALANPAYANYLWLEKDAAAKGAFKVFSGELEKPDRALPQIDMPRAFPADAAAPESNSLPLTPQPDHLQIDAARVAGDLRFSARQVSVKEGGKNALVIYQARYGRAETKAVNDLELVPTTPGGNTFKLMWKGNAVAASQVNVETSEGWRRVLKPGADGTVTMETPFPGLYVMEVTARINGTVTIDGKQYEDVRHVATLSFEVAR